MTAHTITASTNQALCPSPPNASVSAAVTGRIPTTTAYMPTFAQILAKAPMLSRCLWSTLSAGSWVQ